MKGTPWTPADEAYLIALRRAGHSFTEIAQQMGRSWASVEVKCRKLRGEHAIPTDLTQLREAKRQSQGVVMPPAPPPPPPIDPVEAERERQARVKAMKEERDAMRDLAGEKSLRHLIESLFREIAPRVPPPPPYRAQPRAIRAVEESAIFHWSDWHYGEVVSHERTRGFNAYDQDTAATRIRSLVTNARSILARLRRGGHEFPVGTIAVNGDLVTGSIHDMERHSNGKTVTQSVVECGTLLAEAIRDVAADLAHVEVYGTVGNHGRLPDAKRMEQKAPTRNWDWLVYQWAAMLCRDLPHVTFTIPDAYGVGYVVEGWRVLQQHGHEVKSWAGIPWYGIERFVSRTTALESARQQAPNLYLFGHFHTATSLPHTNGETFINGSLIGGTEFSINALGKSDRPTQWLLGVHREHGVTHRWPVYPDAETPDAPDRRGAPVLALAPEPTPQFRPRRPRPRKAA